MRSAPSKFQNFKSKNLLYGLNFSTFFLLLVHFWFWQNVKILGSAVFTKVNVAKEPIHIQQPYIHKNLGIDVISHIKFAGTRSVFVSNGKSITNTIQISCI